MAIIELAIDIGTSNITIFQRGVGIVLKEASVALVAYKKRRKTIIEVGNAAKRSVKASLGTAQVVYPIRDGAVVNVDDASLLLSELIKRVLPDSVFKPRVRAIVTVSCGLTVVERRDVETVVCNAGVKDVILVESPLALLTYANVSGGMFLDIGGGTAEVACVTKHGIAYGCAVNIGGNMLNGKIIDYFVEHYGLKIGEYSAEKLKIDIGSLYENDLSAAEVSGRDVLDSTPRSLEASAKDVRNAVVKSFDSLVEVIVGVLEMSPPELAGEIAKRGVFIAGGTSEFVGLAEYLDYRLGVQITQLRDYDNAVALGAGLLLDDDAALSMLLNMKI